MNGKLDSEELLPSLKSVNPNDAFYGNGQYLSSMEAGSMTGAQLSRQFLGMPFQGARFSNYVAIDTSGLSVVEGRVTCWNAGHPIIVQGEHHVCT